MQSPAAHDRHAPLSFPMEYSRRDLRHPQHRMPAHWHLEGELLSVTCGQLTLSIDGEEIPIQPGVFVWVPGGMIHNGTPQDDHTVYESVLLDLDRFLQLSLFGQEATRFLLNGGSNLRRFFPAESTAGRILTQLLQELRLRTTGYELIAAGLLGQFIGTVLREELYDRTDTLRHGPQRIQQIKKALERIRQDYPSRLTLADLSAEAALSPKYFCRVFRQVTGCTPIDFLNAYRVERAAEAICSTGGSITDIALRCGFNEPAYFSRTFRKHKGMSPQEYRRKNGGS